VCSSDLSILNWASILHVLFEDVTKSGKTRDAIRSVLSRFLKTPVFIKKVSRLIELNRTMLRLLHHEDPWDDLSVQQLTENPGSAADLVLLHLLCLADMRAMASRCDSDFKETDLRRMIISCFNSKSWEIPSCMVLDDQATNLKDVRATVLSDHEPRVQLRKTGNMRVLNLGFSTMAESVLPTLHALDLSGIELYDLRLFPAANDWADLLLRVKAPKDTLFEMNKWAGFTACLKDNFSERSAKFETGSIKASRVKTIENSGVKAEPFTDITIHPRPDFKKTVILMNSPSSAGPLYPVIKGLRDQGLSPFYIKKTCDEKDFCLVVHARSETAPDESIVKEAIHDTCTS
jgi:UTP:GlnB (protein PII) uridylyltransferase